MQQQAIAEYNAAICNRPYSKGAPPKAPFKEGW